MRQDPERAIRATGLELPEEEWAAIRHVDWSLSDEAIRARVSKSSGCGAFRKYDLV